MTSVNTNKGALYAAGYAQKSLRETEASLARLSSGRRVNSSADDAAGLAVFRRMTAQIRSLEMAVSNAVNGISLVKIAGSAMSSVTDILQRMREVSVQISNGTFTDSDKQNAQYELDSLKSEIDRISEHVTFNSLALLDGSYDEHFQLGTHQDETVSLSLSSQRSDRLGIRAALEAESVDDHTSARIRNSTSPNFGTSHSVISKDEGEISVELDELSVGLQLFAATMGGGEFSLDGPDSEHFSIDKQTGRIGANLDFEWLADVDGDNRFEVTLHYRLGEARLSETITLNASVGNETTIQIAEQLYSDPLQTTARQILYRQEGEIGWPASDYSERLRQFVALNQTGFSYSLGGEDASRLTINADSGFISGLTDYEDAGDVDSNQLYEVDVIYSNGTDRFTETITFSITDAISDNLVAVAVPDNENFSLSMNDYNVEFIAQAQAAGASDFSITGTDSHLFTFNQNTAEISASLPFSPPQDRNSDGVYELAISFVNELGQTINQNLHIVPKQIPFARTAFEASAHTTLSATESRRTSIDIGLLSQSFTAFKNLKPDGQLVISGQDSRFFSYDEARGVITANEMNYEYMQDANRDGIYEFSVIYEQGSDRFTEYISFMVDNDTRDDMAEMSVGMLDVTALGGANLAVTILDRAIAEMSSRQAKLGAVQNRLESSIDSLSAQLLMNRYSRSRIVDTDFATETSQLIKSQLLGSSAQKVIANAHGTKQLLLSLIA